MRAGDLDDDELLELDPGGVVIPFARQAERRFIERPACYMLLVNTFPLLFRLGVPASVLASVNGARIVRC